MQDNDDFDDFIRKMERRSRGSRAAGMLVIVTALLAGVFLLGYACVSVRPDNAKARKVLDAAGFTDVRVTDSGIVTLRCSNSDNYYFVAEAKNPAGRVVEVTVCCGVFKSCTVRYE